ncbi:GH39 family glycosyl hydrolase [Caulobacter segnis]
MPAEAGQRPCQFRHLSWQHHPPASLDDWKAFIAEFVRHLIARYSAAEGADLVFEVWNEPDLGFFWSGAQQQYFEAPTRPRSRQ